MVNVTDGPHVHVRFGTLKFLFGHSLFPLNEKLSAGFPSAGFPYDYIGNADGERSVWSPQLDLNQ